MESIEVVELLAANRAFYEAFEARDTHAMGNVWEHSERVVCAHPGWRPLYGWTEVSASWSALFTNAERLQFIITSEKTTIFGEIAMVVCEENILDGAAQAQVAAFNLFAREDQGPWRMVSHIGTPFLG